MRRHRLSLIPVSVILLGLILILGIGCSSRPVSRHREEWKGTFNEIVIVGQAKAEGERLLSQAFQILHEIGGKFNSQESASEIFRINQEGFKKPQKVSPETFEVIQKSVDFFQKSGGAFDITWLPLLKLWGFEGGKPRLPPHQEIQELLPRIDSDHLVLDAKKQRVGFRVPQVQIDLREIAKGYACDEVIKFLKAEGVQHALVNVGGTIGVFGNSPEGRPWRVGLRHPRDPTRTLKVISLVNEAVSTRGDYEHFFVVNSRRYAHILNPRTGYPATESVTVSVIAPSALLADGIATTLFVLGPEKASAFANQFREARWYLTYFVNGDHFQTLSSETSS